MVGDRGGTIVGRVMFVLGSGEVVGGRRLGSHGSSPKIRMG
jgi:hypothetical protein